MKILFATDGRPPAVAAGELLRRLVEPARTDVTVLHAAEFGNERAAESYARGVSADVEEAFGSAGISSRFVMTPGDPIASIRNELATGIHDLTVVGAGNHTWLGRLVFGSVSTEVLHSATTPVLVVHRAPPVDRQRIEVLVGADGSPAAMAAIDALTGLADPARVEIVVRTVIIPPPPISAFPGGVVPTDYLEELDEQAREAAGANLERSVGRLRDAGFPARGSLAHGWPAVDLLEEAEREGTDLVVVGARGAGVLERMRMGSVSGHVARHAPATLVARAG